MTTGTGQYELTGSGSVFSTTNNGRSVYMARVGIRDTTTGTVTTISGTGSTKKQAIQRRDANVQRRLLKLQAEATELPIIKTRIRARTQGLTPSQYLEVWEQIRGNSVKQQTKDLNRQRLNQWLFPWLDLPMSQLTRPMLQIHFNTTLPNAGAGPNSIYDCYGATKALLNSAVAAGYLKSNPLDFIIKKPRPRVWHNDRRYSGKRISVFKGLIKDVSERTHHNHEHYALLLMMRLGLRRAEILGINWNNFSNLNKPNKATLHLRQQLIYLTGRGYYIQEGLKTEKEDGRGREIPIPENIRSALVEHQEATKNKVTTQQARGLVFTDDNGDFISYSKFGRIWTKILTDYMTKDGRELQAGDLWRPHGNRKLAATMMAQAGVPVKVAANILGHNPYVLLQTYDQPTRDDLRSATSALGDI
jgi:integrase